jgi:hypothetical protein
MLLFSHPSQIKYRSNETDFLHTWIRIPCIMATSVVGHHFNAMLQCERNLVLGYNGRETKDPSTCLPRLLTVATLVNKLSVVHGTRHFLTLLSGSYQLTIFWTPPTHTHTHTCTLCVISGFCRDVDNIRALLGYYSASSGNSLPTFRDNVSVPYSRVTNFGTASSLKMGPIRCSATSVKDYHSTPHNIAENRRSQSCTLFLEDLFSHCTPPNFHLIFRSRLFPFVRRPTSNIPHTCYLNYQSHLR